MADNIEVGNLNAKISIDDTGVEKSMAELNREMKVVQSEFKLASAEVEDFGKGTDSLRIRADSLTKQITIQQQKVALLRAEHEKSAKEKGDDAKQTQNLEVRMNQAAATLAKLTNELKATNADLEKQSKAWAKTSESIDAFAGKVEAAGRKMTNVGTQMSMAITAPIVAIGGLATKASIDFESAFAGVRKTVNGTEEELQSLNEGIRDMAKNIPATASEIAAVAEAAGQLGIQNEAILSFTRTMVDLGEATNLSSEQAATALARLANITQMPQENFDRLGSTIVALGNNLATTEAEIVDMAMRLAGAGSSIGLAESQILAIAGALSSVGIEAEAGGSAFSKVMIDIASQVASGGDKLNEYARIAGMSAAQFQQAFQRDAAGAVVSFVEGLGRVKTAGDNVFGVLEGLEITEVRMRDALLRAAGAGDLLRDSLSIGSQAWEENIALTNEAGQRYATTESQLTIFRNKINDTAITLGNALAPALISALESLQPLLNGASRLAERFAGLDPTTQKIIIAITALVAAIGPLIFIAGQLAIAFSALIPAVTGLGAALSTLLLNPVVLAITALTAVVVGVTIAKAKAREETEKYAKAQEELNRVIKDGMEQGEVQHWEETASALQSLREEHERLAQTYEETKQAAIDFQEAAAAKGYNISLNTAEQRVGLSDVRKEIEANNEAFKDLGTTFEDSEKKLEGLNKQLQITKAGTTDQINEEARRIALQNQELVSTENLISVYKTAKQDTDEWKKAQSDLARMFPQFNTELGLNVEAIEGLMVVKRQEMELAWQSMQLKAQEIKTIKETAIAQLEAELAVDSYGMRNVAFYKEKIKQIQILKSEVSSLNTLIGSKPEFIPLDIPGGSGGGKDDEKTEPYKNAALDEAYRQLEHKKRLDQLSLDSELSMLEQIKAKHIKTADERMAIEEKLYDVRKRIAEQSKDLEEQLLDDAVSKYKTATEDKLIREQLTAQQQFEVQKQMHDNIIRDNEAYLKRVLGDDRYTADEKNRIQQKITEVIRTNINERLLLERSYHDDVRQQEIDSINNLSQGVQAALREKYTAEKDAGERDLKDKLDNNEKWRKDSIDAVKTVTDARIKAAEQAADVEIARINSVYGARIQAIQDELNALDQAEKQRSRTELDAEDDKKVSRLRSMLEYERDGYNRTQLQKEIDKILADQAKRHEKEQLDDKKDALKEEQRSLQDKLKEETDAIKKQLSDKKELIKQEQDAQIASINFVADQQRKSLDNQLIAHQQHYAKLLTAKNLQAEAEKLIVQNQQNDIIALLEGFGDSYNITGQSLGEQMYEGFKSKVMQIQSLIDNINAQIAAARSAAVAAMSSVPSPVGTASGGVGLVAGASVMVNNTFNTPVTSPSDVARASQKAAQKLALG